MTSKAIINKAINQLLPEVIGSKVANATDDLTDQPIKRINRCTEIVLAEYAEATSLLADCVPDARRMLAAAQKKLNSLSSLSVLATAITEGNMND